MNIRFSFGFVAQALAVGLLRDYYGLADIRSSHVIGIGRWTAAQVADEGSKPGNSVAASGPRSTVWGSRSLRSRFPYHPSVGVDVSEADAQILREKVHAVLCSLPPLQLK